MQWEGSDRFTVRDTLGEGGFGVVYLAVFGLLLLNGTSRAGYLAPAYTWLLAAGGVAAESAFRRHRLPAIRLRKQFRDAVIGEYAICKP